MVAGLAFQVIILLIFVAISAEYAFNVKRVRRLNQNNDSVSEGEKHNGNSERMFKLFLMALTASTVLILTRSAFRVAEIAKGFNSKLANDEVSYVVLEGGMILAATCTMTVFHPGALFGERWKDAG